MVEIYLLIKWGRQLGAMCRKAGLRAGRYQLLMVACWFGGEFFGLFAGAFVGLMLGMGEEDAVLLILQYVFALFCAAQAIRYPFRRVEQALQLRRDAEQSWACAGCGEAVPQRDSVCPMCGATRQQDPQFAGLDAAGSPPAAPDFGFLKPE